ncbi:MAG: shikimate dehydrogenase [Candidatus Marinimicrobia bacterium]|nr:shikimate dehydrogenase [Candidatus Neomarinimicrobiota bacterium]
MKKFAVIGDPIEHSLSPLLHNWVYEHLGLDAAYDKIRVPNSELGDCMDKIRNGELNGINVTIPHKIEIMDYVDDINSRAKSIGAINVVTFQNGNIIGNNTDWYGFALALKNNKIDVNQKEVILLGAGGVSKGIIFALKQQGIKKIHLLNRTFEKISHLCDELIHPHKMDDLENIIQKESIIINCTSVGMNTQESPIDSLLLSENQTVIDTVYIPLKTKLIVDAESVGAHTMTGLDMFIYQALASQDLWFGETISNRVDVSTLRKYLVNVLASS